MFAPRAIGELFNESKRFLDEEKKYNLPKWVRVNIKDGGRNTGFGGQINFAYKGNKQKTAYIISKTNPYDAFLLCKFIKELSFVHVAYQYKGIIEDRLFNAVVRYRANEDGYYFIDSVISPIFLYNIGYIKNEDFSKITIEEIKSQSFKAWENIIYETYQGVSSVCEEWKDYFVFKEWYTNAKLNSISQTHKIFNTLYDKNNILYSPYTTVLLPHNLYILVYYQTKSFADSVDRDIPCGISVIYGKTKVTYQIVPPHVKKYNGKHYVNARAEKCFDTLEEAQTGYKNFRETYKKKYLKDGKYENLIDAKLYQALLDYEIDIPTVEFEEDEDGEKDYIEC